MSQPQRLAIEFPKRLDSTNYHSFANMLKQDYGDIPEDLTVVFDMHQLKYISSAGLRAMVAFLKGHDNVVVEDVGPQVYEVLDVSGFTSLVSIIRQPTPIDTSLVSGDPIARGSNGLIYLVDSETIVKMFTHKTSRQEIMDEWKNARNAFLLGVPSVVCYALVTDGDRVGIQFEKMATVTLTELIDEEGFAAYSKRFAELFMELHSLHDPQRTLRNVKDIYRSTVDMADYLAPSERQEILDFIDAIDERDSILHGDFHPKNIGEAEGDLILLDMAEISYGHPIFDLLSTYYDLIFSGKTTGKEHPEITKMFFGLEVPELADLWDRTLDVYFDGPTQEQKDFLNDTLDALVGVKVILFPVLHPNFDQAKLDAWAELGRAHFIGRSKELLKRIKWIEDNLFSRTDK